MRKCKFFYDVNRQGSRLKSDLGKRSNTEIVRLALQVLNYLEKQREQGYINMISNSEVIIQSNQHLEIRIDTVIQNIKTLHLNTKTKNQILQTVNEIKQQAESKAPWEEIIGKIMLLLSFGKEALPVVSDLLKWLITVVQ